jgi:hypothetical protein
MLHLLEVGLSQRATAGVAAPSDGEESMHAAVGSAGDGRAAGINDEWETCLAHWTIRGDEERDRIAGASSSCGFNLWIGPMFGYCVSDGLLPPMDGCAWQLAQLLEL